MKIHTLLLTVALTGAFSIGQATAKEVPPADSAAAAQGGSLAVPAAPAPVPTQAVPSADPETVAQGRAIAIEILTGEGYSKEEINKLLDQPDTKGDLPTVCKACMKIEGFIGDPDTNCGGYTGTLSCGGYMAVSLGKFIIANRAAACEIIEENESTICGYKSSIVNGALKKVCSGFTCSSTAK